MKIQENVRIVKILKREPLSQNFKKLWKENQRIRNLRNVPFLRSWKFGQIVFHYSPLFKKVLLVEWNLRITNKTGTLNPRLRPSIAILL